MTDVPDRPISNQLRAAISAAGDEGVTRARIARATGVSDGALSRFVNGHRGLDLSSIDKLAGFLRLRLVREPGQPRSHKKGD